MINEAYWALLYWCVEEVVGIESSDVCSFVLFVSWASLVISSSRSTKNKIEVEGVRTVVRVL
jgi:hypothetical protein